MPVPKSNWIAKSQQMMYPIEMQAIGMSNQANAQIAQSIERTGQRVQEIQLKKQAFAEHHQRTMMMQAAEQQKMALQNTKLGQDREKMSLALQKHQLDQVTGKLKNYQSQLGMATLTKDGNMRITLAGEGGKPTYKEFEIDPKTGMPSPEDQKQIKFLMGSQTRPHRQSSMDQNTQALMAGRLQQQQRDVKESDIKLLKRELDEIKERHDSAKEKFEGFEIDKRGWGEINEVFRGEPDTWKKALEANAGRWQLTGRVDAIIEAYEEMTQAKKEGTAKLAEWKGRVGDVVGGR